MDAKQLGIFIAERRKELGLTQTLLAEKLHVTDKAVSRWERGVGFPDINMIEELADALEVNLIELMQAHRNEEENISTKEAEQILIDTIQLSKPANKITKSIGCVILFAFTIISILLFLLLVTDGKVVLFSVGSIITGLIAWGIPIWQTFLGRIKRTATIAIASLGFALTSLVIQFFQIANDVHTGDWAAIEDTIDVLLGVIVLFCGITFVLNIIMTKYSTPKH